MASYLLLYPCRHDGPFGLRLTNAAGGTWPAMANLSIFGVAWDDPDELDWDKARFVCANPALQYGLDTSAEYEAIIEGQSTSLNDKVTVNFTPCRHAPHHYSFYFQGTATYDTDAVGVKLLPDAAYRDEEAGGNVPHYLSTVVFSARTAWQETRIFPLASASTTQYVLPGNLAAHFYDGVSVTAIPSGSHTFASDPARGHAARFETTVLTGTGLNASAVALQVSRGPVAFKNSITEVVLSRIRNQIFEAAALTARDYNGRSIKVSDARNSPHSKIDIPIAYIGASWSYGSNLSSADGNNRIAALQQLNKWLEDATLIELRSVDETDLTSMHVEWWLGRIIAVSDPGGTYKVNADAIMLSFEVEEYNYPTRTQYHWGIIDADAGADQLTIDGSYAALLVEDSKVRVIGSTANDGLYAVESASYDASLNQTTITLKNNLPDSTADGRLELWDRP